MAMVRMKKLNVVRIVPEEKKDSFGSLGFEEIGEAKVDYDNMSYNDLKQAAKEKNVEGYSSMKKEDLIAILKGLESEEK